MYTVIVIDDSSSMRRILKDMINNIDEFEVIAEAVDAFDAREKLKNMNPIWLQLILICPKWMEWSFKKPYAFTCHASSGYFR